MKYLKTLDIWDHSTVDAIINGQIKIQVGQWLTCGKSIKKSRFVRIGAGKTLHVIHFQGTSKDTAKKFNQAINLFKSNN